MILEKNIKKITLQSYTKIVRSETFVECDSVLYYIERKKKKSTRIAADKSADAYYTHIIYYDVVTGTCGRELAGIVRLTS